MYEQYHPLGIVGIISAFNFPVAVWSWNAMLAWVCGDVCVWKPSEKTPLTAIACQHIAQEVFEKNDVPEGVSCLVIGDRDIGELMANDTRMPLVSATGSTRMGKAVGAAVGARLGQKFVGARRQQCHYHKRKCRSGYGVGRRSIWRSGHCRAALHQTRRLIIHESVYEQFKQKLVNAYGQIRIGNPLDEHNHMGPLIDNDAVKLYLDAIEKCKAEGGKFVVEGGKLEGEEYASGCYVKPCIAEVENHYKIVQHETFAPILYLIKYKTLMRPSRCKMACRRDFHHPS